VLLGERLGDLADHLIGHFVDQARRSGASWTDIGRSMGVTKQAAQKRFVGKPDLDPSRGFARFSAPARAAVVLSMSQATAAGNTEILPAHLLLGILEAPAGVAARALADLGVDVAAARDAATAALPAPAGGTPATLPVPAGEAPAVVPPSAREAPAALPHSARARKVLELTFREALRLGHDGVGTGHLLLALLAEEPPGGPLTVLGVDRAAVEAVVTAAEPEPEP
jgi:ATP-dependent Clp protease ATP-binding subunit ClpA